MKKNILRICLILLSTPSVYAYHHVGGFNFTLAGGYEFFDSSRELRNGGLPLFGIGYDFNPCWGIELIAGGFYPKSRDEDNDKRKVNATIVLVDAIYRFNAFYNVIPSIMAGVGATGLDPNYFDARNEGNVNVGLGLQYFVHPNVAFRADARYLYTIVTAKSDVLVDIGISFVFPC